MVWSVPVRSNQPLLQRRGELLRLCCALCGADRDTARRLCAEAGQAVDWRALVALALEFRLALLLHRAVDRHLPDLADPQALQALRRLYADSRERGLAMTAELNDMLGRLAAQQIPAMAYKGPAIAEQLYGDVGLRTYLDLDLLVRERDLPAVTRVMQDAGYHAGLQLDWEVSFDRPGGVSIDLHWAITERVHQFPRTAEDLWARRVTVNLGGTPVPAPSAEDMLLTLCFNGLTEDWQRLDRIADVAELVRGNTTIDWPVFLDLCRRHGCERIVLLGLHLARELFRVSLAPAVDARLAAHHKAIAAMGYRLDDYLVFAITSTDRRQGFAAWRFVLRVRERTRERLPYLQSMAYGFFNPKADDAAWQRLGRRTLYAVLRLPLLAIKRGLAAIGHAGLQGSNHPAAANPTAKITRSDGT